VSKSEFSEWLLAFMRSNDLDRDATAEYAGVSPKTVSEWKRGAGPQHPNAVRAQLERAIVERNARMHQREQASAEPWTTDPQGLPAVIFATKVILGVLHGREAEEIQPHLETFNGQMDLLLARRRKHVLRAVSTQPELGADLGEPRVNPDAMKMLGTIAAGLHDSAVALWTRTLERKPD
jgi:hypothetical protein